MLLKRDDFQLFFEEKFADHSQFLERKKMCLHLKGECCENFPGRPKWTRRTAQIDKRTYFGNIGLTKIEEMNPEPQHHMTIKI